MTALPTQPPGPHDHLTSPPQATDGPLERSHPASPTTPQGALYARRQEKRLSALGKAECLPSRDPPGPSISGMDLLRGESALPRQLEQKVTGAPQGTDGPLEGRHSAFPSAPQGALAARRQEKRLTALGKAECLPSRDPPGPSISGMDLPRGELAPPRRFEQKVTGPPQGTNGPLEGRHSAFPSAPQGALASFTPGPSISGLDLLRGELAVPRQLEQKVTGAPQGTDGPLEGRHSAFPSAPGGALVFAGWGGP